MSSTAAGQQVSGSAWIAARCLALSERETSDSSPTFTATFAALRNCRMNDSSFPTFSAYALNPPFFPPSAFRQRHAVLPLLASGAYIDTIQDMAGSRKILDQMRREPANVRFGDLMKVCEAYFGKPRQSGTSHAVFKTPWIGDPRINIQDDKGRAKAYQVRQVLLAIDKLEGMRRER